MNSSGPFPSFQRKGSAVISTRLPESSFKRIFVQRKLQDPLAECAFHSSCTNHCGIINLDLIRSITKRGSLEAFTDCFKHQVTLAAVASSTKTMSCRQASTRKKQRNKAENINCNCTIVSKPTLINHQTFTIQFYFCKQKPAHQPRESSNSAPNVSRVALSIFLHLKIQFLFLFGRREKSTFVRESGTLTR